MVILDWLSGILHKYPEGAVYLAVGIGFIVGKIKIGFFSLGTVASALLMGLVVGQLNIGVPGPMKSAFFLLFLFTTGYAVGPQFFKSISGTGIKQVLFALCICCLCFISVFVISKIGGYNAGQAGGLFAGSQTISGALGIVPETISQSTGLTQEQKDAMIAFVPVCYSITYIFGAAGSAFILSIIGPRMLGGLAKVKEEVKKMESEMSDDHVTDQSPAVFNALRPVTFRAYHVENEWFGEEGRSAAEVEDRLLDKEERLFVARIRHQNVISYATPETRIYKDDDIVLSGRREHAMDSSTIIGSEIADYDLLNFPAETLPIVLHKKEIAGMTVLQLMLEHYMYGVSIKKLSRASVKLIVRPGTELLAGDVIEITGLPSDVERAAKHLGYVDRPTNVTDIIFLCLGIVAGIYVGSLMIRAGKIPLSLGTSGGVLLAGLFMGWWRSKRPTFGKIPESAVWLLRNLGLSMYVAVIGIAAAPSFGTSLHQLGFTILLYGAIATLIPLFGGLLIGKYFFKLRAPLLLGCIAGSRTSTPSLGAITEQLNSDIPTIGYSLTYAVSVIINLIMALLIVIFII